MPDGDDLVWFSGIILNSLDNILIRIIYLSQKILCLTFRNDTIVFKNIMKDLGVSFAKIMTKLLQQR